MKNIRQEINTLLDELPEPLLLTVFHFLKAMLNLMPSITNNGNDTKLLPPHPGRLALIEQAGSFADDDTLDELLTNVYTHRERSEIDIETKDYVYS